MAAPPPASTGHSSRVDFGVRLGGLIVVAIGIVALVIIGVVAISLVDGDTLVVAVVSAVVGVIGSIVGAYFGIKLGSSGREDAEKQSAASAAQAQTYALHVQPEAAGAAFQRAMEMAQMAAGGWTTPASPLTVGEAQDGASRVPNEVDRLMETREAMEARSVELSAAIGELADRLRRLEEEQVGREPPPQDAE
jgi:hypothetical protein